MKREDIPAGEFVWAVLRAGGKKFSAKTLGVVQKGSRATVERCRDHEEVVATVIKRQTQSEIDADPE